MSVPEHEDPLLEELDEARRRIFEKCGHDTEKVFDYYQKYQKQVPDLLVNYESELHERPRRRRSA
jgi:uncharacterized protein YaaN involved in tellurite resistance